MSLGHFLLDQGMEVELKAEIGEVISLLDSEVPKFECDGYGYRISSAKGVMGSQWRLLVEPTMEDGNAAPPLPAVGLIEIFSLGDGGTSLRIPPRDRLSGGEPATFDQDGRIFSSFIFQLLNMLQSEGFVDLPGRLPTF